MKLFKTAFAPVIMSLVMLVSFTACGQSQKSQLKEVKIKTVFHCPNGKANIETEMAKEPGVKSVVADLDTKVVTISYEASVTDKDKLVAALERIGYVTEFTPADKEIKKACSHETPPTQ